jgi:hypothetical protein
VVMVPATRGKHVIHAPVIVGLVNGVVTGLATTANRVVHVPAIVELVPIVATAHAMGERIVGHAGMIVASVILLQMWNVLKLMNTESGKLDVGMAALFRM